MSGIKGLIDTNILIYLSNEIRKKKKIKLPDAIIYATAMVNNCELVTADVKDFRGLEAGVNVYNPVPK